MKKHLTVIISILLLLTLVYCNKDKAKEEIYVFYTSDVHCGVNENVTLAGVKALVEEAKAENKNVLLVDTGDYIQGGSLGSFSKGATIIELMNDAGYDCVTIGNHEFDYGMERLKELMDSAKFKITAANVIYSGNKENIFEDIPEYQIFEFKNTKIAFIGVLTPESLISSTPAFFMEEGEFVYDFYSGEEGEKLANKVQLVIDEVRKKGADYVILLSHLGSYPDSKPYDSISLISKTSGVDAVIDGHSHSLIIGDLYPDKEGKDVLLTSVGTKLENVGELIIAPDGSISSLLISECNTRDASIENRIKEEEGKLDSLLNEKLCEIDFDLSITDEEGIRIVRSRETSVADLTVDSIRYATGSDIAVINGGGVRASIKKGAVTFENIYDVNPFGDCIFVSAATGRQILDALEFGAMNAERITSFDGKAVGEFGGFMQVSGLKYTIDTSVESEVVLDENGMMVSIGENRRVKDVYVIKDGEYVPIDPEGVYTVASSNYILEENGDGNTAFNDAEVIKTSPETIPDVMKTFIADMGGIPEQYREAQGRITVK